ncbi:hypothetical protein CC80DRAFT_558968 [Byssothecium circinans]|uniref:Guanine nucleotide exchange factor n=1 Tax=Byssothecium circinans TaxID=147558 RepID=A0A6A5U0P5_9PLEO|nr:hypothetical protein CC80DRAFT_558968 [Byssothecium circinans]
MGRKDIENALDVLEADVKKTNNTSQKLNDILQRLRNHTSLDELDPLFTKRGISICCRYSFDASSPTTGRIALRCLCNILFLAEPTRQIFVNENYIKETVERMKSTHPDDELLSARLLLLCTYGTDLNFNPLFEKHNIAEIINTRSRKVSTTGHLISACSESLKLLYNLLAHYPHHAPRFSESLLPILKILNNVTVPSPPLQPPISSLINPLVYLDLGDTNTRNSEQDHLFPRFDNNINVDRLVHILDLATRAYNDEEMDKHVSPLVQVLVRIAELALPGPKARLRALLLPSNADRERVLGTGDSLPARLLRLSAALAAPNLRQIVPALLFELSDKDVQRFVHNIGYGYAAGFLQINGLQLPSGELDGDAEGGNNDKATNETVEVNPVTGQTRDMEPELHIPEMTDEEKEREAERLFVLFERLRATGVVDVENPVAQAVREGRFEEVD